MILRSSKHYHNPKPKPQLIGQGGYGCLWQPALECHDRANVAEPDINAEILNNPYKYVSKILDSTSYLDENNHIKEINDIDTNNNYHRPLARKCYPKLTDDEYKSLKTNCTVPHFFSHLKYSRENQKYLRNNAVLMIMEHLGENWEKFSKRKDLLFEDIKDFLISSYNVVRGVQHMLEREFVHDDIKAVNLVYDKDKKKSNIIDFGLSGKTDNIKKRLREGLGGFSFQWWQDGPPEKFFLYRNIFDDSKKKILENDLGNTTEKNDLINWFKNTERGYKNFCQFFNPGTKPQDIHSLQVSNEIDETRIDKEIVELLELIRNSDYKDFIQKTLGGLDVYCIAYAFILVTYNLLQENENKIRGNANGDDIPSFQSTMNLIKSIRKLAISTATVNPLKRPSSKKFAQGYEDCIIEAMTPNYSMQITNEPEYLEKLQQSMFRRFPQNRFRDVENSWVDDSELVSKYEIVLKLDLYDFVNNGYFGDDFESKFSEIEYYWNYTKNIRTISNATFNFRPPQTSFTQYMVKKPGTEYVNLLGSHYVVYISFVDDSLFQEQNKCNIEVPCIFIDEPNNGFHVQWRQINHADSLPQPTTTTTTLFLFFTDIVKLDDFCSKDIAIAVAIELICLTFLQMYTVQKSAPIVHKIRNIICDPDYAKHEFHKTFVDLRNSVQIHDSLVFQKAYIARIYLSILRKGIANEESDQIKKMRNLFNLGGLSKRSYFCHSTLKQIQDEFMQPDYSPDSPNYEAKIDKIKKLVQDEMFRGMDDKDIAFKYRGIKLDVADIIHIIEWAKNENELSTIIPKYEFLNEDVADRINMENQKMIHETSKLVNGSTNNQQKDVEVYTSMQVECMLEIPGTFQKEYNRLINRIVDGNNNNMTETYVIFTNKSDNNNINNYLLHGFKLRHASSQNAQENNKPEYELVILVPEPCIFKVLEPVAWRFVQQLRIGIGEKLNAKVFLCKEENTLLSKLIYSKRKIYVSRVEALIQVELIANNKMQLPETFKLTNDYRAKWAKAQYTHMLKSIFFSSSKSLK